MAKKTKKFKTEVQQLLDLVIHSLYSKKEIYLRELISNASDAIDRAKFEALTDSSLLDGNEDWKIKIHTDKEERTISITDNGIGMSPEEVEQHIGIIANSGTKNFLEKLKELGRLEDTIVVVTNDHGEEIYDHGSFGHGWTLFEEMIQAPLMIHYPPMFPEASIVDDITEHVDLAPTVLEAMGLPPMKGTEGTSFLPTLHGSLEQEPRYAVS